jgi:hypothetical protein
MPHRRKPERGSFKDHFDGLVAQFPHEREECDAEGSEDGRKHKRHINDLLFERASRD